MCWGVPTYCKKFFLLILARNSPLPQYESTNRRATQIGWPTVQKAIMKSPREAEDNPRLSNWVSEDVFFRLTSSFLVQQWHHYYRKPNISQPVNSLTHNNVSFKTSQELQSHECCWFLRNHIQNITVGLFSKAQISPVSEHGPKTVFP